MISGARPCEEKVVRSPSKKYRAGEASKSCNVIVPHKITERKARKTAFLLLVVLPLTRHLIKCWPTDDYFVNIFYKISSRISDDKCNTGRDYAAEYRNAGFFDGNRGK